MKWRVASVKGWSWSAFTGSEYPRVHFSCNSNENNEKELLHRLMVSCMYDITEEGVVIKDNKLQ